MFKFFDWIVNVFSTLFQMLTNIVTGMYNAIVIVSQSMSLAYVLIPYIPSFIATSIYIVVAIGIIKLILGWGNS